MEERTPSFDLTPEQQTEAIAIAANCHMTLPADPQELRLMLRTLLIYVDTRCSGDRDDD